MRLVEIKRSIYAVYDDSGKVVIITRHKRIAERFLDGKTSEGKTIRKNRDKPKDRQKKKD